MVDLVLPRRYLVNRFAALLFVGAAGVPSMSCADSHGLDDVAVIFVGASWCPHCKQAAPVLAAIMEPAGVPVLVASHDGRPIAPFPFVEDARLHPIAGQILRLPTTLIYNRVADTVVAQIEGYGGARRYAGRVTAAVRQAAALSPDRSRQNFRGGN